VTVFDSDTVASGPFFGVGSWDFIVPAFVSGPWTLLQLSL